MGKSYGRFIVHREDDQTDRIGIRTLILSQGWMASHGELSQAELDAESPAPPEVDGGLLLVGAQIRPDGGSLRTWWTYEGVNGDGKSVTFKDRDHSLDWRFEPGYSQVSIVKHPKWPQLKAKFGGELLDGQVIWPDTIPNSGGPGFGTNAAAGKVNPLFGHEDFIRGEGTYFFRYAALDDSGMLTGVGEVHASGALPGKPPRFPGRDWLKIPPASVRRGMIQDITEGYWLSGAGGWPREIYGNSTGGPIGGGLVTGTLSTGTL